MVLIVCLFLRTSCSLVCNLVEGGVQAIFSSSDCVLATHINSICDDLDIPDIGIGRSKQDFSINVHPSQKDVNRAFIDVIQYLNWTKFGILYEKDHGKSLQLFDEVLIHMIPLKFKLMNKKLSNI